MFHVYCIRIYYKDTSVHYIFLYKNIFRKLHRQSLKQCGMIKGPHPRQRFQAQPRCAARSRLRLLLMVYPHTQRPICSIFLSSLIVRMSDLASDDQIAHQISENSDQQQPQQRSASHGGGCGCRSPYTGNLVEVAVGNRGCD